MFCVIYSLSCFSKCSCLFAEGVNFDLSSFPGMVWVVEDFWERSEIYNPLAVDPLFSQSLSLPLPRVDYRWVITECLSSLTPDLRLQTQSLAQWWNLWCPIPIAYCNSKVFCVCLVCTFTFDLSHHQLGRRLCISITVLVYDSNDSAFFQIRKQKLIWSHSMASKVNPFFARIDFMAFGHDF